MSINSPEPAPVKNELPNIWELVMQDMHDRDAFGVMKYGTHLQPRNGRKPLRDAYQEVLDLSVYLRQKIWEDENGR